VPVFEARRAEIMARAKGAPVLLARPPEAARAAGAVESPEAALSTEAAKLRAELSAARAQATTLFRLYPRLAANPALAREVLLSDGYLFAETPSLAFGLGQVVRLEDLFDERRLWLERGARRRSLVQKRRGDRVAYVDEQSGQRATLLFLDRVAVNPDELGDPLHYDLSEVHATLGFESAVIRHLGQHRVVLDARYGRWIVPTLLAASGARLDLECEAVPPSGEREIQHVRSERLGRNALVDRIRRAIDAQIAETLPFDEPRTEYGQEDGKLREAWLEAYFRGHDRYEYNEDRYHVFGPTGRPAVPQVCIDFITDTLERAAGTGYAPRGEVPRRIEGGVDFDAFDIPSRRRVPDFVAFAEQHPDWFDVWRPARHVPLRRRQRFFDFLFEHRAEFQPGDIVIIYGPRDDGQAHYHSFFIVASDPLTGMPVQVASNAVLPQVRSWEGEMSNAPERSIRVRIRPRSSWLARVLDSDIAGE
jgi:hypothetical protein